MSEELYRIVGSWRFSEISGGALGPAGVLGEIIPHDFTRPRLGGL